jgi:hypothetical protein
MKIQNAKNCEDWENFVSYQIEDEKKDLNDTKMVSFFLNKVYGDGKKYKKSRMFTNYFNLF